MDPQLLALLLVVVTMLVWRAVTRERREYAQFKRMRLTSSRQKIMRKWMLESVLVMGGLSAALLIATWDIVPVALAEAQSWAPIAASREFFVESSIGRGITIGAIVGGIIGVFVPFILVRNANPDDIPKLGDVGALIPRTRGELRYGAGLGLSAGVFEETLFRLAIPALLFGIWPNAPLAFGLAAVLFGMLHLYQKVVGVIFATLLGVVLTYLYLVSGSILVPIIVHAVIDLRSLVVLPLIVGKVWSKEL
ncbi:MULTISPECIES: CPBP family intramembrane glutamic endopeptidase [unclassified Salinibacterium]|uniref:CPBP family intramembrane glutamic endopeptidase n=1 Tax=unclassified Salinibacterium TaxID=2632331 RepID=UPI0014225C18|nr:MULTISPECIES: CPBP family intramembrane glutamic endopeptidase [unclassified Salinibacterium]